MSLEAYPYAQPLHGLIGGILIGLAAAIMLLGTGRIAGVSGITARASGISDSDMSMISAWGFLVGLPLGALAAVLTIGLKPTAFAAWPVLVGAGLLVGVGTSIGSGCTSGHGVCGVSRFSLRSVLATATFIAAGIVTVAVSAVVGGAS